MKPETIKLFAVGDIFLGEHPFTLGHGVTTVAREKGCDFIFDRIKAHLKTADIVFGNLEGIISRKEESEGGVKSAIFWGESSCAEAMHSAGINCLSLANNHTAQHGKDALDRTCSLLDKNAIKWTGYDPHTPESPIPAIFDAKGIKVGILAYCETQQYNLDAPILPTIKADNIGNDVQKLKEECDIVVVSLHWGDEFIEYPSPEQMKIAHKVIDSGADVILGHHSHVMQGIEQYRNGLIVYSLGSFVKDLWRKELKESIILEIEISANKVEGFGLVPVYINDQYQPEIYSGEGGRKLIRHIDALSNLINVNRSKDMQCLQKEYDSEVDRLEKMDKIDNLKHYIKNIFRYDKKMLFDNVILIIKRRIYRKNI